MTTHHFAHLSIKSINERSGKLKYIRRWGVLSKVNLENLMASQDVYWAICNRDEQAEKICEQIICKAQTVDSCDQYGVLVFHALDYAGICGSRLVKFWDEVCGKDVICMITLIRACQLGIAGVTKEKLDDLIDFSGYIDIRNISRAVHERFGGLRPVQ